MARYSKLLFLALLAICTLFLLWHYEQTLPSKRGQSLSNPKKKQNIDSTLFIYNRIPKTGSTSFMSVLYKLTKSPPPSIVSNSDTSRSSPDSSGLDPTSSRATQLNVLYVNVSSKSRIMTPLDESWFVHNITTWSDRMPAIYHGHFPFINFVKYGKLQPIYINILRPPLERLISHYYFVRYGDTFRPNLKRSQMGDTRSFDDCVKERGMHCSDRKLWLQIPYFCGSMPQCWEPGNQWALSTAKTNLASFYYLVGVTEKLADFMTMLEMTFPRHFKGASAEFSKEGGTFVRKTKTKKPVQPETVEFFKKSKIWQLENEFYLYARTIFYSKLQQFNLYKKQKNPTPGIMYQKVLPVKKR